MKKFLLTLIIALPLSGCDSLTSNAKLPIISAPGELKVIDCEDLPLLPGNLANEVAVSKALTKDAEIVACLKSHIFRWIDFNNEREKNEFKRQGY